MTEVSGDPSGASCIELPLSGEAGTPRRDRLLVVRQPVPDRCRHVFVARLFYEDSGDLGSLPYVSTLTVETSHPLVLCPQDVNGSPGVFFQGFPPDGRRYSRRSVLPIGTYALSFTPQYRHPGRICARSDGLLARQRCRSDYDDGPDHVVDDDHDVDGCSADIGDDNHHNHRAP